MLKKTIYAMAIAAILLTGCNKEEEKVDLNPATETETVSEPETVGSFTSSTEPTEEAATADDDWYETFEGPSEPVDTSAGKVQMETVYDFEKGDPQQVTFTSREQNAANNLPYYFKNVKMDRRNKKDFIIAEPDTASVGELYVNEYSTSLRNVAQAASESNYEELLQIVATILPKTEYTTNYLDYFFKACTLYERNLHGVDHIEREDGADTFTGYDKEKHKIEVTVSTGKYKYANNTSETINEELKTQVAKRLYDKLGVMLPEEAQKIEDEEAEMEELRRKSAEEAQKTGAEGDEGDSSEQTKDEAFQKIQDAFAQSEKSKLALEILQQQGTLTAGTTGSAAYKTFTDKTGTSGSYTQDEWAYLQSLWAYTGHDVDTFVMDHKHTELRNLLNNR